MLWVKQSVLSNKCYGCVVSLSRGFTEPCNYSSFDLIFSVWPSRVSVSNMIPYLSDKNYTVVAWSCCLNCPISLAWISEVQANGKIRNALLFSTDIHLPPEQIVEYYQARFQIEFIFRDAKQFTGLSDCQARHLPRLDFHFNASLIAQYGSVKAQTVVN